MSLINCFQVLLYVEIAHMVANLIVICLDKFEIGKIVPSYLKLHRVYQSESESFMHDHLEGNPYNLLYMILK